jgi:hypothetical protein
MNPSHNFARILFFIYVASAIEITAVHADESVSKLRFNQNIRPILSNACFRCHGFDAKTREADLRLDTSEGALARRDGNKAAILPGKLDESLVWERINSTDPDVMMPPPSSNRQLSDAEKKMIANWIEQGAHYEKHWSFEPISAPVDVKTSVDRFLTDELSRRGITAQGPADPITQVRRLSFTLTGLPPNLSDVERFAAEPSDANYAKLVDQYLNSSHFGEELAKHWLDVARYGDTHGLHLDNERQAWAFRDWVVDAFNSNMPYSQFTIEQLAGDLLPNPTQSQLVATGFNRSNVTTSEGGAISDEFLFRYAVDRTSTTVQAWLGLTAGCAVCHDHKYDPISTKEFYSLYAFFYSAADPAMDGNINTTRPFIPLPTQEQSLVLEQAKKKESQSLSILQQLASDQESIAYESQDGAKQPTTGPFTAVWIDDDLPIGATLRNTTRNEPTWVEYASAPMGRRALRQEFGHKYEQTVTGGLAPNWIPDQGKLQVWLMPDRLEPPQAVFVEVKTDGGTQRWVWCDNPEDAKRVDSSPDRVLGKMPQPGRWTELTIPLADFHVGKRVKEIKLGLFKGICYWDGLACTGLQREDDRLTSDFNAWWASVKGTDVPLAKGDLAKALKEGPESELGTQKSEEVATFFRTYISETTAPGVLQARQTWRQAMIDRFAIESQIPGTFIFNDEPKPRQAFVMMRGQYDQKGEEVAPNTPAMLPPLASSNLEKQRNRLDLAEWLISPQNPLTARVAVNRFWQQVFGVGLVKTSDDFGSQGSPPSHPDLLDDLANRFRANGWNVKDLMRELVTTSAFRRSAVVTSESLNADPENRFLARGPRIRLDAEQIRDNVLAVSGLLNRKRGGPGVKVYQPGNIWEPVGYGDSNTRYYVQDHGDDLYRRSLYSFIKRTAPPPFMSNFDAPNREMICARRERSNTPLQALQLMNDIQHVEAARVLAERVLSNASIKPDDRISHAFQLILSRRPTATELKLVDGAHIQFQSRFNENGEDAKRLIAVGEKPYNHRLSPQELAAFTLVTNLILNLDETVNRN